MAEIDDSPVWATRYSLVALCGGGPPEPPWDRLDLEVPQQEQANWCWAATSDGVAHYYDPGSTWAQCSIANTDLGRTDCCGSGASGPCNTYGYLNQALATVGHLGRMEPRVAPFSTVEEEMSAKRPLGIRVAWSGGGAHFLAIGGYADLPEQYVHVEDPWYGPSDLLYTMLESGYQGSGSWTHTYWTKA